MNKFILIKVNNNIKRFLEKCNKYNIELFNINYIDKDKIIVKIKKEDFDNIKKYNYYSEIDLYRNLGIDNIKDKIFNLKYFILIFILCIIIMYLISNIILKVNVIHSNKNIRELVYSELENYGIKKYSYKKDFNELESIKNKIIENNKDKLEWISITNVGMTYVVRVEERIIDNIIKKDDYCNLIAEKETLITKIYSDSGDILVNVNDIVKKDDILISGRLTLNEETKGYTCASGKVMGRVWYNTNISIKREYTKKEYTNKKRLNIVINHKVLRSTKFNKYDKKYIIKNRFFSIYREIEYIEKKYKYNDKDGIEKALKELKNKFNTKLGNNGKIISKKITNKYLNNDSINIDVFVVTEEIISKQIKLDINEIKDNEENLVNN